ncbi:hypothetical protein HQ529_04830, partial [Candidatus Woesearchaeota archaeon]|nr:hypothetical protein [Candidatus Woesearchaeota archaeon]
MENKDYFEGILQLRNPNDEVVEHIRDSVEKKKNCFISKEEKVRGGIDFYFSSQRFLQSFGRKLHNSFGGNIKTSAKIHTRDKQKSKDVYRVNVLIYLPDFKRRDIIFIDNRIIKVLKIGKSLTGFDIMKNKATTINYQNKKTTLIDVYETEVTKVFPALEVLHPETFQSVVV